VRRDLPWRRTRDPWGILVSECMLQQTQVTRVIPKWEAFLEHFPTATACADAPLVDTIRLWQGLGYNRRAVQLHAAACAVRDRHGGTVPGVLADLLALPGVGAYTARAVRTFAYECDDAVVDTNVARIMARAVAGRRLRWREVQGLADGLVPEGEGWAWNQGVLDLGATICLKQVPRCGRCPVRGVCAWQQQGCEAPDPALASAGVSGRQPRFAGSDRQGRGRLVDALRDGPVADDVLAERMGWPTEPLRAQRVAAALVRDGLAHRDAVSGCLRLGAPPAGP
jgi:A/G-specific adenine glycosylase